MTFLRHFFANRRWQLLLLVVIPCALFFFMRAQLSWRPRVIGKMRGGVTAIAWSPDGKWLAGASGDTTTWNATSEIYVISLQDQGNKWIKIPKALQTLQFTANGDELVGIDISHKLYRWDWQKRRSLPVTISKGALAISGNAAEVAAIVLGGVAIYSVQTGRQVGFLKDPRSLPKVAVFSADSKKIALFCAQSSHVGHPGNSLQVWKIAAGNEPISWTSGGFTDKTPFALQFWPDDKSIAMLGPGSILVSASNGDDFIVGQANVFTNPPRIPFAAIPFACGKEYVSWFDPVSYSIQLQQWPSKRIERQLKSRFSSSEINALSFSPDGSTLAAADDKGVITLWRIK